MVRFSWVAIAAICGCLQAVAGPERPADLVLAHARIYTADGRHSTAESLAVRDGRIIGIGSDRQIQRFVGPATELVNAGGRRVLPGLIDAHVHPTLGLYELDICDLKDAQKSLAELTHFVADCVNRYQVKPGQWLTVEEWNYAAGNETDAAHPNLRAALDLVSKVIPIQLLGSDFHHGAFNSAALALARVDSEPPIGYSRKTLHKEFSSLTRLVGVDANGEPDGTVNENARDRMAAPGVDAVTLDAVLRDPEKTMQVLNQAGITGLQDAWVRPGETNRLYDLLSARGHLTARVNLMQFYQPESVLRSDGEIDYDELVRRAKLVRDAYAHDPLIKADGVKIVADGVLEGNPRADPPTLPNSPILHPFLQPIFGRAPDGSVTVTGYVDTDSPICVEVREQPARFESPDAVSRFKAAQGYGPGQCVVSSGKLLHTREVILEYAKRMHLAGFTLHIHAIGDLTVRTAVDAIEAARAADGNTSRPDTIAHLQLVSPEDVLRIGRDHLFTVYTLGWAATYPEYDVTVIPFIERVRDASYGGLHQPGSYYERQAYPTASTTRAGGILAAGSDAPVGLRNPRPFDNMAIGMTRQLNGLPALGPKERLDLQQVVDAYTINAARALGREDDIGSLETGKSADFIILDQDIVALAAKGHPERIATTKVQSTWFRGRRVFGVEPQHSAEN